MKLRSAVIAVCLLLCISWKIPANGQVGPANLTGAILGASDSSAGLPLNQGYTVRRDVSEVQVHFIATDGSGRPVLSLRPQDVQVFEDQAPVPELKSFILSPYRPLKVGVLVDLSDSISSQQQGETLTATDLLEQIFDAQRDKAFVVGFSDKVRLLQPETADISLIRDALAHNPGRQGLTSLYDALVQTCQTRFAGPEPDGRDRILLLFSDGSDTLSIHGPDDAVSAALRAGVTIYAITTNAADREGIRNLKRLAEETGGRVYVIAKKQGLETLKVAMSQSVRGEYTISFRPATSAAGFHSVRIALISRSDITLRASTGYYMGPQ